MLRFLPRLPGLVWAATLFLVSVCPAQAHRVNVFAYVEGDSVVVECSYSRSQRVRFGAIEVVNAATGTPYLTGKTDETGSFRFPVPPEARAAKADLRIVLRAGEGHQNEEVLKAAEYLAAGPAASAPTPGAAAAASPPAANPDVPSVAGKPAQTPPAEARAALQPEAAVAAMDPAVLQAVVEAAVEKKIAPLRAILVSEQEKGPGLREIIGGIGWLVGLAGIAAYIGSRRRSGT
ncbi:hypothetical protein [Desulfovibrio sp. TomC]|uniref:hypothetical protein n=1 Tax=Desulfovibrio sp. TomC TaxID=1562888 RepID=UPI0005737951|nr:hypothetical protein [Desulfovibrio sp. TomC]KHK04307.1 Additional component NikL of nickel ECF transporter [Desulfovibrio sp. TomC]